ncbi:hypothetical protein BC941DRAFT_188181 [Chlamydoabsidia padenii]|nr:hypothetical protein BC941DRAFT_188181 [Chlamydoabsidia padenii]
MCSTEVSTITNQTLLKIGCSIGTASIFFYYPGRYRSPTHNCINLVSFIISKDKMGCPRVLLTVCFVFQCIIAFNHSFKLF